MRRPISRKARAPKGSRVSCECSLPSGQRQATVEIFTGTPGYELSPYVDPGHMSIRSHEPIMHKPMYTTLRPEFPAHKFEFIAGEDQFVQVMQDMDLATDPSAKAKVIVHGKAAQKIGWLFRDALRSIRDRYAALYRRDP